MSELQLAVQELVEGTVTCGRGAIQALYASFHISSICWRLIGPTIIAIVGGITQWYRETFTLLQQLSVALILLISCIIVRLWVKGTLARVAQQTGLLISDIKTRVTLKVYAAKRSISRLHSGLVNIGSIALPALALTLPARFYASKVVYRRLLSCVAAVVPQLYSISALMSYYSSEATLLNVVDDGDESAVGLANQISCWLAYYMLAEVIDCFAALALYPCRLIWGRTSVGIDSLARGVMAAESIEVNPWTDVPLIGSWFHQPTAFESEFGYGALIGFTMELVYSTLYFVVLMLAIKSAKPHLMSVIKKICEYVDTLATTLYGSPIFFTHNRNRPSSPQSNTAGAALLPTLWAKRRSLMPLPIVRFIELASYMPQLLLLLLPSFILGPAYVGIATILPLWRGARSLLQEEEDEHISFTLPDRAHLLTYLTLFNFMEIFLMRWVRDSALWQILPVTRHMDVIYVTVLQLICASPNAVARYLLNFHSSGEIAESQVETHKEKVTIKEEPPSDDNGSGLYLWQQSKVT